MPKTSELLEQRAAAFARMQAAQETGGADFDTAEREVRDLDAKITRSRSIDELDRRTPGAPIAGDGKLDAEIRSRFSLARAIAGAAGLDVDWGFEREMQAELAKRAGKPADGVYIPTEIFEKRVLTSTSEPEMYAPEVRYDQFISALTANSVVRGLGATVLNGLTTPITIPRETGSPAVGWVAENQALSSGDATFDSITLSPKHAGALTEMSRNMVLQTSPDVEQLLRNMLARDIALVIDRAAIKGGGTNEPFGILSTAGIQTAAYATDLFTTTAVAIGKADVANVNASRGFLTTPGVRELVHKAKDAQKLPVGVAAIFHDEPTAFSNQVPVAANVHSMLYGDWSELLIGVWSEIDILVNPYESTAYSKGNISIRAMATVDAALRHPAAFVSVTGVNITTATALA